ncbi:MAG: hypothetical protein IPO63_00610 [Bacteroidetes bacterium]|nr:hypothetical protein [Bacteroidota bacterium]
MMTEHISFLFGSGFSAPENIPTVGAINKKLRQLKKDEFYLGSDQRAFFYQTEWRDPNGWMTSSTIDRLFAQEFIAFYCKEVLHDDLDAFNYEVFYDYFSEFLRYQKHKDAIGKFCETFRTTYIKDSVWASDDYNFVWRFSKIFNQRFWTADGSEIL